MVRSETVASEVPKTNRIFYCIGGCNWQEALGDAVAPLSSMDSLVSCQ